MPKTTLQNTSTDELRPSDFREDVELLKHGFRKAALEAPSSIATIWTALHELAFEMVEVKKGTEQAEMYWDKLVEFSKWQFAKEGIQWPVEFRVEEQ